MERVCANPYDSKLVNSLKEHGFVAVRLLLPQNFDEDLYVLVASRINRQYNDLHVLSARQTLSKGHSFEGDILYVAYARLRKGQPIPHVNARIIKPSGETMILDL